VALTFFEIVKYNRSKEVNSTEEEMDEVNTVEEVNIVEVNALALERQNEHHDIRDQLSIHSLVVNIPLFFFGNKSF
jgi:hypothetical protein